MEHTPAVGEQGQGRRQRSGRSGERRTTFLADHAFGRTTFFFFSLFCCAYPLSVKLINRIIKSVAFNACFVNAMINNSSGSFHLSRV